MSLNLSNSFKKPVLQQLKALRAIVVKANEYADEHGMDHNVLLGTRLFPNMWSLSWQLQFVAEFTARAAARLSNTELPSFAYEERSFDEILEKIDWAAEQVSEADDDALNQSAERIVELPVGPDETMKLSGQAYLQQFFLPNLYFHVTTAYNILRQAGMPLAKKDYIGGF